MVKKNGQNGSGSRFLNFVQKVNGRIQYNTYYTGRVHSILGPNLNIARQPHFGQFFTSGPRRVRQVRR